VDGSFGTALNATRAFSLIRPGSFSSKLPGADPLQLQARSSHPGLRVQGPWPHKTTSRAGTASRPRNMGARPGAAVDRPAHHRSAA